mmetsp:Transcript_16697/g.54364  ORF Transcript_16697/g.54364 Transcript_16697/m.54364 type:complete len:84 (-) Transcript_16697:131-382(-)
MSAIFDFSSLMTVMLLFICTCTYVRGMRQSIFDDPSQQQQSQDPRRRRRGIRGVCWKASRVGERVSPYVAVALLGMSLHILFF